MRYLGRILDLSALPISRKQRVMHVVLVQFEQVLVLEYPDTLIDQLLGPHSVIAELQLERALVVSEEHLERSTLGVVTCPGKHCTHVGIDG